VSGFGCQEDESQNPETLYETTPKWHSLLMIRLAVYQANGGTHMKLRLAGTANRLNIENRTSNIERRILIALHFLDLETNESQNPPKADKFRRMVSLCTAFFKIDRIHYSMLDVQCSMFDVHFLVNPL
jgi:hypothetical protein